MKYIVLFFAVFCFSRPAFTQPGLYPGHAANGLEIFSLGDPLSKYDSLVTCAGAPSAWWDSVKTKKDAPCFLFRFLPAVTDTIRIGPVRFPLIVLSSSFSRKIDDVLFIASYGVTSGSLGEEDYNSLVNYLNSIFKNPEPYISRNDPPEHSKKGWSWKQDDIQYSLVFTAYNTTKKRVPPGLKYAIDFHFRKLKPKKQ